MGIGKRILNVLIGLLFIISVTVLGSSFLAKKVLVDAISQAGVDTAISHRMMDAVFGYAGADDTEWIAKIQNKIEKNGEVQAITQKVMNEITEDLSSGKAYKDVDVTKELNRILDDSMQEIKDTNPELSDDMLAMMKQQLKEELVDVQDVLIGLIVDGVSEVLRIPETDVVPPPDLKAARNKYIRGISKTGKNVTLLLDWNRLFSEEDEEAFAAMTEN